MRVGIDVGEAFVGNIGQRALYDFTAVGDVVNTASRLQGQASPGEVALSERVAEGVAGAVGNRVERQLQGKREPQTAYRLASAADSRSPLPEHDCVNRRRACGSPGIRTVIQVGERVVIRSASRSMGRSSRRAVRSA
jgi:hypothetical protein